jgi:hypothetical protein
MSIKTTKKLKKQVSKNLPDFNVIKFAYYFTFLDVYFLLLSSQTVRATILVLTITTSATLNQVLMFFQLYCKIVVRVL